MRRRAAALAVLLLAAVASLTLGPAGRLGSPHPAAAAPGDDDDLPVTVLVDRLTPTVLTATSVVSVAGQLRNDGPRPVDLRRMRLRTGRALTTRSALSAFDARTAGGLGEVVAFGDSQQLSGTLAPGRSVPFHYDAPVDTLGLERLGVYPVELSVRGVVDGASASVPVGSAVTYLPWFPEPPREATEVAWLWPLVDRPHRGSSSDLLLDDDLAGALAPGGRLDVMLGAAERASAGPRPTPLTLAVDPDLVETVAAMADGYRWSPRRGERREGGGQADARDWLDRLRALVRTVPVVALPYGDPDTVALDRAGLQEDGDAAATYGEEAVRDLLDVEPVTGLAWPPDGVLTDGALDDLVARGTRTVVLSDASLPAPESSVTPGSRSPLAAVGGDVTALVLDGGLDRLVGTAHTAPGGPRLATQRVLAELAMVTAQSPNAGRALLLAPPRRWSPSRSVATALLTEPARVPWVRPVRLADVVASRPVPRGPLTYPAAARARELGPGYLRGVGRHRAEIDDVRQVLSNEAAQRVLTRFRLAQWRAESSAWRRQRRTAADYTARFAEDVTELRGQVRIVSSGTFSLASSNSPLVLTVANDLDEPVTVRIGLSAGTATGFRAEPSAPQTIGPRRRQTVRVSATTERSGAFTVSARLLTPEGRPLGAPVDLRVRSTAYGRVAIGITGTALGVLLVAVGVRLWRRARRPRADPSPAAAPEPEPTPQPDPVAR